MIILAQPIFSHLLPAFHDITNLSGKMATKRHQYIFNQTLEQREQARLKLIERYHDPRTKQRLLATGLREGWHCLEVGPGGGSIMRWMAKRVGKGGFVQALDINPRFIRNTKLPNVTIQQGDIASASLPTAKYHLVHARFVLIHTQRYRQALARVIKSLRPEGWMVLEEPDFLPARPIWGTKQACQSVERVNQAICKMFEHAGLNPGFGLELPRLLTRYNMTRLRIENEVPLTQGGSALATIMERSAGLLREEYLGTGMVTSSDIHQYCRFAKNPSTWAIYHGTVIILAQKPKR